MMGVVRGSGSPDLLPPDVQSVTRGGVTISRAPAWYPKPFEAKRAEPCRYCRTRLKLDRRGRCQECGAPEHLANARICQELAPGIIVVPDEIAAPAAAALKADWLLMDRMTM